MPSTSKTELVQLNQYLGNECQKRTDINEDNLKIDNKFKEVATSLLEGMNILVPKSGSTANAILLNIPTLTNNKKYSFKATAASTGNMTINGKAFKKLDGTQIGSGGVKANKVYDFYYSEADDCVFILAKAIGTATVADVLAPKTFSNGDDIELVGGIPSKAAATITPGTTNQTIAAGQYINEVQTILGDADLISANIKAGKSIFGVNGATNVVDTTISSSAAAAANIQAGYKCYANGVLVTGTAPTKAAATITPRTTNQTIAAGTILTGLQTILGDADLIPANILSGKNIFGVAGSAIEYKSASGSYVVTSSLNFSAASLVSFNIAAWFAYVVFNNNGTKGFYGCSVNVGGGYHWGYGGNGIGFIDTNYLLGSTSTGQSYTVYWYIVGY